MRILGIDPGIGRTGWGVIEYKKLNIKYKKYGCIETAPNKNSSERLHVIYQKVQGLIREYSPDVMAVEELFFNTNAKTAFAVGEARGVILLAGAEKKLPVFIYTPLQVKVALTGYGRAEKMQVGKMVKVLLKLKEVPKPDDVTDALAVALTHAFSKKYPIDE